MEDKSHCLSQRSVGKNTYASKDKAATIDVPSSIHGKRASLSLKARNKLIPRADEVASPERRPMTTVSRDVVM